MNQLEIPTVERVVTGTESHIEPPIDPDWPQAQKLAWHAAVVAVDMGINVSVHEGSLRELIDGVWHPVADSYSIGFGSSSDGALDYRDAWTYLSGMSDGFKMSRNMLPLNVTGE